MMRLAQVLAAIAVLVGMTMFATDVLGDRELFTPPPDTVAEGFVRAVVEKRYEPAREYLRDPGLIDLQSLHDDIEQRLGEPSEFDAETLSRSDDEALVRVTMKSASGSAILDLAAEWDKGEWTITESQTDGR